LEEHEGHAQQDCAWLFDINLELVWDTVQTALPYLVEQMTAIRDELANDGRDGAM
jgi:uncharacterized protein with HEPN domain